jgi:large subunit ribosomal protein L20
VEKALQYAWRDRKAKKRDMRSLWIQRVNAATKEHGVKTLPYSVCSGWSRCPCADGGVVVQVPYSRFMHGLQQENIQINRKVLSELAMQEPFSFKALLDQTRTMRG